jgi:hypothetical protein
MLFGYNCQASYLQESFLCETYEMKRFSFIFIFLIVAVGFSSLNVAEAQNTATIKQLELALWPDYDRHAVLVIYRVQLTDDTPLPASVLLPVPVEAGDPYAVAWLGEDGRLLVADYMSEIQDDWNLITLTSGSLIAQLEFYLDYEISGSTRSVIFEWPEGFPIEDLRYEVKTPDTFEILQLIPAPENSTIGSDGLQYQQEDLGQIDATQSIRIELSYTNPGNQLTIEDLVTPEPFPSNSQMPVEGGTPDILQMLPWLLGGFGLCLFLVGGVLYFQSRHTSQKVKVRPRVRKRVKVNHDGGKAGVDPSTIYCHQCGTKASISDRYCRHCGVPLRR